MPKKKPAKKPSKPAKKAPASPLKKVLKKAVKALTGPKKAPKVKAIAPKKPEKKKPELKVAAKPVAVKPAAVKPVAEKGKKTLAVAAKAPVVVAKAAKGKGGKSGPVVEVVIPPSHPVLKNVKEKGAAAPQKKRCREPGCDHETLIAGYCRLHYIKNWRRIKRKEAILASGQLNNYVEELVSKYPDKYLEVIRQDLASEKDWAKVVIDLELEAPEEDAPADEEAEAVSDGARRERDFGDDDSDF